MAGQSSIFVILFFLFTSGVCRVHLSKISSHDEGLESNSRTIALAYRCTTKLGGDGEEVSCANCNGCSAKESLFVGTGKLEWDQYENRIRQKWLEVVRRALCWVYELGVQVDTSNVQTTCRMSSTRNDTMLDLDTITGRDNDDEDATPLEAWSFLDDDVYTWWHDSLSAEREVMILFGTTSAIRLYMLVKKRLNDYAEY
ncbi:uncharacterized protein LOC100369543 [Saccoglossus kowalevskii]|uniref:Uncharacterized protein LOC100369543 n=1 Tax=Saccoglossus kowalevskii TaxID=10224 RepID=A0ABM0GZ10_SACKO|nr:PREDICTED: uncharacterized protein LOC100369543 [Saccoglossus kowalevskii]